MTTYIEWADRHIKAQTQLGKAARALKKAAELMEPGIDLTTPYGDYAPPWDTKLRSIDESIDTVRNSIQRGHRQHLTWSEWLAEKGLTNEGSLIQRTEI